VIARAGRVAGRGPRQSIVLVIILGVTGSGPVPERYLVGIQLRGVHDDARGDRFARERDVEPMDARLAAQYLPANAA